MKSDHSSERNPDPDTEYLAIKLTVKGKIKFRHRSSACLKETHQIAIWRKQHQIWGMLTNQALWFEHCIDRNYDLDRDKRKHLLYRDNKCNPINIRTFCHDQCIEIHSSNCTLCYNGTGNTAVKET